MQKDTLMKTYTNGTITVVWKPGICIHSTICWKEATGLPSVFNPRGRPWIQMEGSDTEKITTQVQKCPSGALSFYFNDEHPAGINQQQEIHVDINRNGPLIIRGEVVVKDQNGIESIKGNVTAFCRCGLSANKPYCDGSHKNTPIEG